MYKIKVRYCKDTRPQLQHEYITFNSIEDVKQYITSNEKANELTGGLVCSIILYVWDVAKNKAIKI